MIIKNFIYLNKILNTAYCHKKNYIKLKYKSQLIVLIKYFYKYSYIKYVKYNLINQQLIIYLNYCCNNNINLKIHFFKLKQYISINYIYLYKLNYNYLISISNNTTENVVDRLTAIKNKNNGRLIALLY